MTRFAPVALAAWLALASAAPALAAPPATIGPSLPSLPAASPTVTVTAPPTKDVSELVHRFGRTTSGDRLARWEMQACPEVIGDLPPAFGELIASRIRQTAASAIGMPIDPHCDVNIVILILPDAQALARKIAARQRGVFSDGRWPVDRARLAAWVADDHPVRVWHVSRIVRTLGGAVDEADFASVKAALIGSGLDNVLPLPQFGNVIPSRLRPSGSRTFTQELVLVERGRISGLLAGQVSAYLAMVTLAEIRPDADLGGVDTIMNLFDDQKTGRAAPPDLTFWDRAYLQGLYRTGSQVNETLQESAIGDRIRSEIVAHNVLPLSQTRPREPDAPSRP